MEQFKELLSVAETVDSTVAVYELNEIAENLIKQPFTKIAVLGGRCSGKTKLINRLAASEVFEPGNMDEKERPRRLSFEPMEAEIGIDCAVAVNPAWHDLSAVFYEWREEDMLQNGKLAPEKYAVDIVYFIISANAPFNMDEVRYLRAMEPLNRQVIVTGIDYVNEQERDKVEAYISKINDSLGLSPVIFLRAETDAGKTLRKLVPDYLELQESRKKRADALFGLALSSMVQTIERKMLEKKEKASKSRGNSTVIAQMKADCFTLRTDIMERCSETENQICEEIREQMRNASVALSQKAMRGVGGEALKKAFESEIDSVVNRAEDKLRSEYLVDLRYVDSTARILSLPGWTEEAVQRLSTLELPEMNLEKPDDDTAPSSTSKSLILNQMLQTNWGRLILTGLAAGGVALTPLPVNTILICEAVVLSAGAVSCFTMQRSDNARQVKSMCEEMVTQIENAGRKSVEQIYSRISDVLKEIEEKLAATEGNSDSDEEQIVLENALSKCRALAGVEIVDN